MGRLHLSAAALRQAKVAFVSGHRGTSGWEVSALATAPVVLLLLWRLAQHPASGGGGLFHRARPGVALLAAEWAVLVLPLVAVLLGVASPGALLGGAGGIAAALYLTQNGSEWQLRSRAAARRPLTDVLRGALTCHRASLMLLTCTAILAVDFPAFPRRWAKAERFGTGFMDAGVGGFVAAAGLARGLSAAGGETRRAGWRRREAGRAMVLALLGLARLAATHATGYQHVASEYGLHWNFFLTLAALRLLGLAVPCAARGAASAGLAGGALLAAYQWVLSSGGSIAWVHSDERGPGLVEANKEGLASLAGYWALELLAIAAGHAAYRAAVAAAAAAPTGGAAKGGGGSVATPTRRSSRLSTGGAAAVGTPVTGLSVRTRAATPAQRRWAALRLLAALACGTAALWAAYWLLATRVQPVSRRACNAAYVVWVLALSAQSVTLFAAADAALPGGGTGQQPHLLAAVSGAMLPVFLAANLLTGAVNLAVNTLAALRWTALAVLAAYTAALCGAAVVLHERTAPAATPRSGGTRRKTE